MTSYIKKVEQRQYFISSSLLISPADWELPKILDNNNENAKLYLKIKKSSRLKIIVSWDKDQLTLVELGQRIVLLNNSLKRIEYYVQYEFGHFRKIKTITQIALWAYKNYPLPSIDGLSAIKWTFFNYLLPKADAIAADTLQTEQGKSFWIRRIGEAWDKGLHVYMILRDKNNILRIENRTQLSEIEDIVWGTKRHHEYRRAFISKSNIFPDSKTP